MARVPRNRPHLYLQGGGQSEPYTSPQTVISGLPPARVRAAHAQQLQLAMGRALEMARGLVSTREAGIAEGEPGFYLQFDIPAAERAFVDGLENKPKAIELVAVRPSDQSETLVSATVFMPARSADFFAQKIEAYRVEETRTGKPKNEALIARIETVRLGAVRSLFTDSPDLYPPSGRAAWWEVWLREDKIDAFRRVASRLDIRVKPLVIAFPERDVVLALADETVLGRLIANTDAIAELRLAKDTPSLFLEMRPVEQAKWVGDLADRTTGPGEAAPAVCVLDSGANRSHPLIEPALRMVDQHTIDDSWGVDDSGRRWHGHGTAMLGVVLYGDLEVALTTPHAVALHHRLETVKILPNRDDNDPELYGAVTQMGVGKVEDEAPRRRRLFCMAVSSDIGLGRGRPSSWSAAIDKLSYGGDDLRRLFVLSAGNIREGISAGDYPDRNDTAEAESPCQAWNALVAGAYTDKVAILHPDYAGWAAVAPAGDLCPTSRTSGVWDRQWPIRPDVVFEGGNLAHDGTDPATPIDDLRLLTTHNRPSERLFTDFGDTSAATALTSRLAVQIMAARTELWPETVRALVVHSAEWTPVMRRRIEGAGSQAQRTAMLRRYGWGVPDHLRALYSASDDATLMVQDALLPFKRENSTMKTRDMNLHLLPWPRAELASIGVRDVELRVTLSYFVEPNPGERGWTRRHRYASHGLRFAVKRSLDTLETFRQRINRAVEAEESGAVGGTGSDHWLLGPTARNRGSIHSDIWRGSAADLAERDAIGVFPVSGWWKEKPGLQRWDRSVRYALVVSIRAPESEVDIYTAIANQISVDVPAS